MKLYVYLGGVCCLCCWFLGKQEVKKKVMHIFITAIMWDLILYYSVKSQTQILSKYIYLIYIHLASKKKINEKLQASMLYA